MRICWLDQYTFHADKDYLSTHLFLEMRRMNISEKKIKIKINLNIIARGRFTLIFGSELC